MAAEEKKKLTPISDLGEFGLIEHISEKVKIKNKETRTGIGDDAAVLDFSGMQTVVTSDILVEGVHFDLMYTPLKHLGYKAVIVNLSDVVAMNAIPKQIIVSIAMSGKFSVEAVDELYSGIYKACEAYGVDLVGGDTTSSVTGLTISVTAIGAAQKEEIVYRSGARENDIICATGDLGAAYMGLQLLEREKEVFKANPHTQPELSGNDYILSRILKPEARLDVIKKLRELLIKPTAMMDISDGLSSELLHICKQSHCGCRIYQDKLAISQEAAELANEMNLEPLIAALNGGEDYELVFTIDPADYEKIKDIEQIVAIGHVTSEEKGKYMVPKSGENIELKAQGWNAYKK
ncbi:Thiamine-monophosphate kinase [Salinivirga cyanobacteriivorans]|uniref:Thiamine-monophosphate kinase n=1 Tax=Salinivirga cyanobacteriivorans TaxID=1307839 RepID=A0A0S2I0D7_9BACT|nr:thiamine-phosphate kinase [Salinivirga cyanobacteriivorans]ALO15807.1 Thiamine-monophosphate kinase [Salinivirga cyanobacteriivorans]